MLEKYDYSGSVIEYGLKVLLNVSQDRNFLILEEFYLFVTLALCFKNISTSNFIFKLLFLLFLYKSDEVNCVLIIKNLKVICSKGKKIININVGCFI